MTHRLRIAFICLRLCLFYYDLGVGLMFESSWCHLCDPFYDPLALLKATKDPLSRPFKTKREKTRDLYSELLIQRVKNSRSSY